MFQVSTGRPGGTHVRNTHEIGPIQITGISRAKKQTRVEFIAGNRVLRYARDTHRALESISQTVSSPPLETPVAVAAVWQEFQQARKRIEDLESRLLDHEAADFPIDEGYGYSRIQQSRYGSNKAARSPDRETGRGSRVDSRPE